MSDLFYLSIAEASSLIQQHKLSPLELTHAHLDRIQALDSHLRCFITLTSEIALREAQHATEEIANGRILGPLHGIPVTYKDLLATAGVRTTAASRVYADWVPAKSANVVTRLQNAGTVMLGKVKLSEFAFAGGYSEQDFFKPARNPWNAAYDTGGSSSGSAVGVAAGLSMASVGTDGGGSIRIPSANCGVTGLKPTYGLVGRSGDFAGNYSLSHVGPIARSVEDVAIMLEQMAGYDPNDRASLRKEAPPYRKLLFEKTSGLRLGVCPSYMEAVGGELEVQSGFRAALDVLRSSGFEIREVAIPHLNYAAVAGYNNILRIEMFSAHYKNFCDPAIRNRYGRAYRNIVRGGFLSSIDYLRAQQARGLISAEVAKAFESIDVLLTPTTPVSPALLDGSPSGLPEQIGTDPKVNSHNLMHDAVYTCPFNLTGHPVLTVPSGFSSLGLPLGLQLVGRPLEEATVMMVGHQYQDVTDWHRRIPPLR
jgi:Asp-tRNA(Asn)/Glu-tRNA(Gln) amidotransferase A subunit family amidase